ncbi:putative phosphoglycerate mutase family protein [Alloactinosynnema sp. L-07]|uniref:acid phosphatase n=1 Tax=Alloactinosynnema sp. L-07 TaxID=1653480 RepID=UPI00065F0349|nr:acid phosphatase [Alloactinosynnema sp. L-07]CRK59676.1 putative phosphoglycerate mutase family protein [Alloactinosynnema sp. L-07]
MLYLLRHGQTEWSESGRHTGRTDIDLTPDGEAGARKAGELLRHLRGDRPAVVLSSPRKRAVRTAELAGLIVDEVTEDLAEWDYGDYEGRTTPQIRETVPDWTVWTHPCPNGETAEAITDRAAKVAARVRDIGQDVVLIGHGHFSRVLISSWIGQSAEFGVHFGLEPAGVSILGDERGVPQIERLNVPAYGETHV